MKIFAWIHRKLHTNVDYSIISPEKDALSGKKSLALLTCEALLCDGDQVPLVDALGDGILAIGTFGLDPLNSFGCQDGYSVPEEKEYSLEEDGKLNPLAVEAFQDELERAFGSEHHEGCNVESEPFMSVGPDNPLRRFLEVEEFGRDVAEKKKERTTLADLFNADAAAVAAEKATATGRISGGTGKKSVRPTKHVRSLAKRLMPGKKREDSRPTTKLHHLMRRMLRRKIHPDLERKINEGIGSNGPTEIGATLGGPGSDHNLTVETGGNESRSLLQGMVLGCA